VIPTAVAKILIIDDEECARSVIRQGLALGGFAVTEAPDGATGLKLARVHAPDLILCDVNMDGLNGYEVLAALRNDPVLSTTPFVLMTGLADLSGMRQGMTMGADDYLAKPFGLSELLAAVNNRLQKSQLLRQQADQKLASLRSHISMMLPHELLTPLIGILGASEILRTEAGSLSRQQIAEFAQAIKYSGARLQRLIQNFLIYARIELLASDPARLAALDRDPTPATEQFLKDFARGQAEAAGRGADLRLELVSGAVAVSGDHLQKIFAELIDNAFKFSKPGTPVSVVSTAHSRKLRVEISDQGRGMKPEYAADIGAYVQFERKFYEQQGSGLGLIIAKRLAEIHGGQFSIQSQPGEGTQVSFALPLAS
jgi:signal transduction histidine kinase